MEARLKVEPLDASRSSSATIRFAQGGAQVAEAVLASPGIASPVECAYARVLEIRISLAALGLRYGEGLRFALSLWQGGLPMDAVPQQGWLEMRTTDPGELE
jgi:hypothetical protein